MWKGIEGYPNYEVSNTGCVRNIKRGSELRPGFNKRHGYLHVNLCNNGAVKTFKIHKLVASAFLGPANGQDVDHINNDCSISWCFFNNFTRWIWLYWFILLTLHAV